MVQKALYPEGPEVCQCVIVHPPAGIAGGDRLWLDVAVGPGSFVQLTTPGAAKWYRSGALPAVQTLTAQVAANGVLEWLPLGAIVHDGARARSDVRIDLERDATFIGSDVVGLGRRASGERFRSGEWRQRFDIVRGGAPIWSERAIVDPATRLLVSAAGLNAASVFGTFVAVGTFDDAIVPALRDIAPVQGEGALSRLPDLIVARYRGDAMGAAHAWFTDLWSVLRPALARRIALRPRIWNT